MISFGLCAALLGLSSIVVALAALHWTRRASGLVAGVAVTGFFFNPFFDWDRFLIWQLLVMLGVQTGCLVVTLLAARSFGWGLAFLDDCGRCAKVRFALVQLAVVRRCHVGTSAVHDDPVPLAAGWWVSVRAAVSGRSGPRTGKTASSTALPTSIAAGGDLQLEHFPRFLVCQPADHVVGTCSIGQRVVRVGGERRHALGGLGGELAGLGLLA